VSKSTVLNRKLVHVLALDETTRGAPVDVEELGHEALGEVALGAYAHRMDDESTRVVAALLRGQRDRNLHVHVLFDEFTKQPQYHTREYLAHSKLPARHESNP